MSFIPMIFTVPIVNTLASVIWRMSVASYLSFFSVVAFAQEIQPKENASIKAVLSSKHEARVASDSAVIWAINVGGPYYLGADGILFQRDESENGERFEGEVMGAQDSTVFNSYRTGPIVLRKEIANGYYDVIFKFSEPNNIEVGERVFNVIVEGEVVVSELDVMLARDGNPKSSLSRMAPNVLVNDGVLDIRLEAVAGNPILSAVVVRKRQPRDRRWTKVWGDEFDYEGVPDPMKWSHDIWPAEKVNNEEQAYTQRLKNTRVADGLLTIEAHKEAFGNAEYTSGRLHSAGKGDLLYGRIEVRAKLPAGRGTWPAIWMLPSNPFKYASTCSHGADWQGSKDCDAWPNSGEIDIMEHVGYDMNRVHGTVHTRAYYWVNGEQRKASVDAKAVDQEFHVYSMEWSPERIDVFYDDALYFTYLNQDQGWKAWPFDHPFHLILNVAVGGGWGSAGGPTDVQAFPTAMQVDYVRMYKKGKAVQ